MSLQNAMEQHEPLPTEATQPEPAPEKRPHYGRRKVRIGRVVSDKPDKTVVVAIERDVMHPLYRKTYKRTTKVMAHDEGNQCRVGDIVKIVEWRPLSRRKRWMVVEILQRSHQLGEGEEL